MASAADQHSSYGERAPLRRRLSALVLATAANLLLLFVLLRLAPPFAKLPPSDQRPISFPLNDGPPEKARTNATTRARKPSGGAPPRAPASTPAPRASAPPPVPPVDTGEHVTLLELSQAEIAATDSTMRAPHADRGAAGAGEGSGTGAGSGAGSSQEAGIGPHGEQLYNAEWYREPTRAEMVTYYPRSVPGGGWAEIACRTVAAFHVEDCVELGQSPSGSGLSRALREASWQFRVRPPRIGGKALVGAWVRIHFDFIEEKAK